MHLLHKLENTLIYFWGPGQAASTGLLNMILQSSFIGQGVQLSEPNVAVRKLNNLLNTA